MQLLFVSVPRAANRDLEEADGMIFCDSRESTSLSKSTLQGILPLFPRLTRNTSPALRQLPGLNSRMVANRTSSLIPYTDSGLNITEPPAGQLRLASPATVNFTANLIKAAAGVFPSKYFSTGGDEINANCYAKDPQTQQDLSTSGKTFEQALDVFTQATHGALKNAGKIPVVWEGVFEWLVHIYDIRAHATVRRNGFGP
jgi:Glycosyl hydrolase family 20, catalytic domain